MSPYLHCGCLDVSLEIGLPFLVIVPRLSVNAAAVLNLRSILGAVVHFVYFLLSLTFRLHAYLVILWYAWIQLDERNLLSWFSCGTGIY